MTNTTRLASWVTAVNVLVASGFSLAGLFNPASILPPGVGPNEASSLFAMYAAARTIPLAVAVLVAVYKRSVPALLVLGALAGAVQLLDAIIGVFQNDPQKVIGPLVLGILQFYAVFRLQRASR